jgi:hypothetical protein
MTKTPVTHPTGTPIHAKPPCSWRSAVRVRAADYDSFSDWGVASLTVLREHVASIWLMTRAERIAAYVRGELTHEQVQEWTGRAPREVPRINGEFAHIAASTPEACFPCPVCGDDEVLLAAGGVLSRHADHRDPNWGQPGAYAAGVVPVCPGSGTPARLTKEPIK